MSRNKWGHEDGNVDPCAAETDDDFEWDGIPPDVYMELVETVMAGKASHVVLGTRGSNVDMNAATAGTLLWMAAQEESFELVHDILPDVRQRLGDWSEADLDCFQEISIHQLFYACEKRRRDPERHGDHKIAIAQILRFGITPEAKDADWHWSKVESDYSFELVLQGIADDYHREHVDREHGGGLIIAGRVVQSTVRKDLHEMVERMTVDPVVSSFRDELDALFPSAPEGGNPDAKPEPD